LVYGIVLVERRRKDERGHITTNCDVSISINALSSCPHHPGISGEGLVHRWKSIDSHPLTYPTLLIILPPRFSHKKIRKERNEEREKEKGRTIKM